MILLTMNSFCRKINPVQRNKDRQNFHRQITWVLVLYFIHTGLY